MKKINLIGIGLIMSVSSTLAQKGVDTGTRYGIGEDSVSCVKHLSLYSEDFKNKNYEDAYPYWLLVLDECPLASINVYKDGPILIKNKMDKTKDPGEKQELYQLLLRVYDMRMQYFGNDRSTPTAAIKGLKANEMLNYGDNRNNIEVLKEVYKLLDESVDGMKEYSQPAILLTYSNIATQIYRQGEIDAVTYINSFSKVSDIVETRLKDSKITESVKTNLEQVKDQNEQWFASTDAASCENLESIFSPQFEANNTDLAWLKRVDNLLAKKECQESELFYKVAEHQHKIEPSASSAFGMAKMNSKAGNIEQTLTYFLQAVDLAETDEQKGLYLYNVALIYYQRQNYQQTRAYALRAISARPNWGAPYLIIGRAYAFSASSIGKDDFSQKAVYWAAVDKFKRAKAVDSSCSEEANNLIKTYSAHFPPSDEIFMQGHKVGDSYTVEGWINETTTIQEK